MKISNLLNGLLFILTLSLLTSCAVTEEIWVDKKGSGKYEMTMNMGGMMGFLSMMDTVPSDEPKIKEVIDSSMTLMSLYEDNDSIDLSVLSRPELLDQVLIGMHIDEANEVLDIKVIIDFDSFEHADDIMAEISKLKTATGDKASSDDPTSPESVLGMIDEKGLGITWSKGKIIRKAQTMDNDDLKEFEDMDPGELQMMKSMLGGMEFKSIIHLPGKVKKVSDENGKIINNNSVEFTYDLGDILEAKEYGGFEIRYK